MHHDAIVLSDCQAATLGFIAAATVSVAAATDGIEDPNFHTIGTCHQHFRSFLPKPIVACSCHFEIEAKRTLYSWYVITRLNCPIAIPDQVLEYCQQLRKHIKEGGSIPIEQFQYIDTKQYWMNECNRIHKKNVALENKVRFLEEAQRILKDKLRTREHFEEDEANDPKYMHAQAGEEVSVRVEAGISRKRQAPTQDVFGELDGDGLLSALDNDKHLQLSGQGEALLPISCERLLIHEQFCVLFVNEPKFRTLPRNSAL